MCKWIGKYSQKIKFLQNFEASSRAGSSSSRAGSFWKAGSAREPSRLSSRLVRITKLAQWCKIPGKIEMAGNFPKVPKLSESIFPCKISERLKKCGNFRKLSNNVKSAKLFAKILLIIIENWRTNQKLRIFWNFEDLSVLTSKNKSHNSKFSKISYFCHFIPDFFCEKLETFGKFPKLSTLQIPSETFGKIAPETFRKVSAIYITELAKPGLFKILCPPRTKKTDRKSHRHALLSWLAIMLLSWPSEMSIGHEVWPMTQGVPSRPWPIPK